MSNIIKIKDAIAQSATPLHYTDIATMLNMKANSVSAALSTNPDVFEKVRPGTYKLATAGGDNGKKELFPTAIENNEEIAVRKPAPTPANIIHNDNGLPVLYSGHGLDKDIVDDISMNFNLQDRYVYGMVKGKVRGIIIEGPPGVGKTFGVEKILNDTETDYERVAGKITPVNMYKKLYDYNDPNTVLIFDDCDAIFQDMDGINLIKAVTEMTGDRRVAFNSTTIGNDEDYPTSFVYEGKVIIITNVDVEGEIAKSGKMAPHMEAIVDRCMFLSMGMRSIDEKVARLHQVVSNGFFDTMKEKKEHAHLNNEKNAHVIADFVYENRKKLRGLSIRTLVAVSTVLGIFYDEETGVLDPLWKHAALKSRAESNRG